MTNWRRELVEESLKVYLLANDGALQTKVKV